MSGKEDASAGGADGSQEPCQLANSGRMYCRSASWLSSRTSLPLLNPDIEQDGLESNGSNSSRGQRPLAPRSQQSFKARQRLPLLQPLAIARRSLDEWPRLGSDDIGEWPLPSTPSERDTNSNSERLNLDLSNIHKNPEINAGLVRREKIAFFDKECSKVAEHVFLGGDAVAKDKDILKQNGITHVLNCVGRGMIVISLQSPRWTGRDWRNSRSRDGLWSVSSVTGPHPMGGTDLICLSILIDDTTWRHNCVSEIQEIID
ncbi:hypothetical protein T459_33824 [Capsicum annuum]|uniref:Uncharacterized protein n=1 Tax=Capsicum annuum TaxID=4072 RepID=A0A2G2XXT0_CAPAN|nr:hypothetical protein T459_33824 [Capsicum annuum]